MKNNIIKIAVAICTLLLTNSLLYAQNVFYNVPIQNQSIIGNALNPTTANPIVYATQFVAADKTGLIAIPTANDISWRSNIAGFKYQKSAGRVMITLHNQDL